MAKDPVRAGTTGRRARPSAPQIAVIGGSNASPEVLREAEAVGRELALAGANLVCGGLSGVMAAASRGAAEAGGFAIGILPGTDRRDGNPWLGCAIPTGLGHFRNFLVVHAGDGVIALPGGSGTLSEAAMARTLGKPVVTVLASSEEETAPGAVAAASAADAVQRVLRAAAQREGAPAAGE